MRDLQIENVRLNRTYEALQSELFTLKGLFQHIFPLTLKPTEVHTSTLQKIITSKFEPSSLTLSVLANGSSSNNSSANSTMPASPASSIDSSSMFSLQQR